MNRNEHAGKNEYKRTPDYLQHQGKKKILIRGISNDTFFGKFLASFENLDLPK